MTAYPSSSVTLAPHGIRREGNPVDDPERYRRARRKVRAMRGFYIHAIVFVLVNIGLVLVNVLTTPAFLWSPLALFGWATGLAAHGLAVFGGFLGRDWEERQIQRLLEREARRSPPAERNER
jgi:hypothetical protein